MIDLTTLKPGTVLQNISAIEYPARSLRASDNEYMQWSESTDIPRNDACMVVEIICRNEIAGSYWLIVFHNGIKKRISAKVCHVNKMFKLFPKRTLPTRPYLSYEGYDS